MRWNRYYLLILVVLALAAWGAYGFDETIFNPVTMESITDLLVPLFVIAAFLERALEVFISSWRGVGEEGLEGAELAKYKAHTKRIAFLSAVSGGVLISIAGIRVLHPLTDWDAELDGIQGQLFDFLDILITGGLLAGGSEGIHQVFSVITDFLKKTRDGINA